MFFHRPCTWFRLRWILREIRWTSSRNMPGNTERTNNDGSSYLMYHYNVGSVRSTKQGWIRGVYFPLLISHTVLAAVVLPLVLRTAFLALKGRFVSHVRIARWTFPTWMYVSITGVVVYLMLYH